MALACGVATNCSARVCFGLRTFFQTSHAIISRSGMPRPVPTPRPTFVAKPKSWPGNGEATGDPVCAGEEVVGCVVVRELVVVGVVVVVEVLNAVLLTSVRLK